MRLTVRYVRTRVEARAGRKYAVPDGGTGRVARRRRNVARARSR